MLSAVSIGWSHVGGGAREPMPVSERERYAFGSVWANA